MAALHEQTIHTLRQLAEQVGNLSEAEEKDDAVAAIRKIQQIKEEFGVLIVALLDHCVRKKMTALSQDETLPAEHSLNEIVNLFLLAQDMLCPNCRAAFQALLLQSKSNQDGV